MEKIQKDREFSGTQEKGRWSKVEAILAVLFVIAKCVSHDGKKMNSLHIRVGSSNAPVISEIEPTPLHRLPYADASRALAHLPPRP